MLESPDMASGKHVHPKLYLASHSPRRRELLALTGWDFSTLSASVDETPQPGEDGINYVKRLAANKARAAAHLLSGGEGMIIAADTTVVDGTVAGESRILGKPQDQAEAVEILRSLRGHIHQVHTGISLLDALGGACRADLCTTAVPMRNYTDEEIEAYAASGDPLDKAGAYAIQHACFHPVDRLEGCYANVMGLPLCHLTRSLSGLGIQPFTDVPTACQAALGYRCPVYSEILNGKIRDYTCGNE